MTQSPRKSPRWFLPSRRWLRFSLRALLVFMLLVSLPLGWLGMKLANKRAERKLALEIDRSGGLVSYDWKSDFDSPDGWSSSLRDGISRLATGEPDEGDVIGVSWSIVPRAIDARPFLRQVIRRFPQLRDLNLDGANVDDASLRGIERLSKLEVLDLGRTPVTDEGLKHVAGLRKLKVLGLDLTDVSDVGFSQLTRLPDLHDISVRGTCVSADAVAALRINRPDVKIDWTPRLEEDAMAAVRELHQRGWIVVLFPGEHGSAPRVRVYPDPAELPTPTDSDRHLFERLPPFEVSLGSRNELRILGFVVELGQLEELFVWDIDDEMLLAIGVAARLKVLRVHGKRISDKGLAVLRQLPNLEILAVAPAPLTREGFEHITEAKALKSLSLGQCTVDDEGFELLGSLSNLESLNLEGSQLSSTGLKHLVPLVELKKLNLSESSLDDAGLAVLIELPQLEHLDVRKTRGITSDGINRFQQLRPDVKLVAW